MKTNESCTCDEANEEHDHCKSCDCVLRWDEGEYYCRWCEQRMLDEKGGRRGVVRFPINS